MKEIAKLISSLIVLLVLGNYTTNVVTAQKDMETQIQTEIPTNDLKNAAESEPTLSIEDALKQFRTSFNKNPIVPKYIPFEPTYSGGLFNEQKKVVSVGYLNVNSHEFMSLMITTEDFVNIKDPVYIKLHNSTKAIYVRARDSKLASVDFIRFQKDGLTYQIGISNSERNDGQERLKELVEIANSM